MPYFIRWDNIQVQETTPDGAFVYQGNAGQAKIKGLERSSRPPDPIPQCDYRGLMARTLTSRTAPTIDCRARYPTTPAVAEYELNPTLGRTGDAVPNVPRFQANSG